MFLLRQSKTIVVYALFLIRLDTDGIHISIFFPSVDAITSSFLNAFDLYNASAASDIRLLRNFLIIFTMLAAFLHVLSKCVASVKVGPICIPTCFRLVDELSIYMNFKLLPTKYS